MMHILLSILHSNCSSFLLNYAIEYVFNNMILVNRIQPSKKFTQILHVVIYFLINLSVRRLCFNGLISLSIYLRSKSIIGLKIGQNINTIWNVSFSKLVARSKDILISVCRCMLMAWRSNHNVYLVTYLRHFVAHFVDVGFDFFFVINLSTNHM